MKKGYIFTFFMILTDGISLINVYNETIYKPIRRSIMDLEKILDELDEYIYITDLETYDLLYANKATLRRFNTMEWQGKKCYEMLLNEKAPCSFCKCNDVKDGKIVEWSFHNPVIQRQAQIKDMFVEFKGRAAKLQIAYDVSDEEIRSEQLQHALDMEQITVDCLRQIYKFDKPEKSISYILAQMVKFLEAERAYIFEIDGNMIHNTYEWCSEGITPQQEFCQNMDISLIDMWMPSFERKERYDLFDIEEIRKLYPESYETLKVQNIKSVSVSPLFVEGRLYGCVGVDNPSRTRLEHFTMIDTLSYFLGATLEQMKMNKELVHASYFDLLTGLYNRNRYSEDLELYSHHRAKDLGVVYIDVNGLKEMNDRFGHRQGDDALCECADILKRCFDKKQSTIYRVGGDEFVVFAHYLDEEGLQATVNHLENEFVLSKNCKGAIGYAYAKIEDDLQKKIAEADSKMYVAKQQYYRIHPNTDRYRFYNDITLKFKEEDILLEEINCHKFEIFLQPKMNVKTKEAMSAEALIRYRDEEGGLIYPDQFIATLEEAKLIHHIDLYVFKAVCELLKKWKDMGLKLQPISVNFSHFTLTMPNFENDLEAIWQETKIDKSLIEIEVVEHLDQLDPKSLISIIDRIKRAGFLVSINDFGVKYANLALFINSDVDILKSDRALMDDVVENKKSQMLLKSLAKICHELDMQFIAEGVETKEQFDMLMLLGCDGAQGYLFDKPMPIVEYEKKYMNIK